MAINQNRRVRPDDLESDTQAVVAIQMLVGYAPLNPTYTADSLTLLRAARDEAQAREMRAQHALNAARAAAIAAEWALHNAVLGARVQVLAQYGPDSDAVQSMGVKKRSEYKRPARGAAKSGQLA